MAETIRFEYRSSEDYKPSYVNGVHGGLIQVTRFIQTGLVMNLETAKQVSEWLDGQITALEEINKGLK